MYYFDGRSFACSFTVVSSFFGKVREDGGLWL